MLKLLSTITVIPKFLFITDVKTVPHHGAIGIGGFGHVFPGEYKGQQVALKMMENRHVRVITRFLVLKTLIGSERIQL